MGAFCVLGALGLVYLSAQNTVPAEPIHLPASRSTRQERQHYCLFLCTMPARCLAISVLTIGIMYTRLAAIHPKEVAMQVGDILRKKAARVATVRMNETVAIAAQLMRSSNISALVVKDVVRTEGNTAVGMFTERDVVRAIAEHGAAGANLRVSQFISVQQLVSCSSTDSLEHVRHLMNKHHIRHVPVLENYSLIGVVSIRDISTAFDEEANAQLAISA
jgi:CBS domain-containing protein